MIDPDLKGHIWTYWPTGVPGVTRTGGIDAYDYTALYGDPPYRFKVFRQNGGRAHLRMVDRPNIERRAYTNDLRRGIYWTCETEEPKP